MPHNHPSQATTSTLREHTAVHHSRAFRQALDHRLKATAKTEARPFNILRRQFVLECYLARVFALYTDHWILKGGTGLVVRIPGARHSRDLDLCHTLTDQDLQIGLDELVEAGRPSHRDPFAFDVARSGEITGKASGLQLTVTARLGASTYDTFPIDMTTRLIFVGPVETQHKPLPLQIEDVAEPPPMRLYPLSDQVADKVAAMYEMHNNRPPGRFRDLVDLVIITTHKNLDGEELTSALRAQEITRRITLPTGMRSPGPAWVAGHAKAARDAHLDAHLLSLDAALTRVGAQVDIALRRLEQLRPGQSTR